MIGTHSTDTSLNEASFFDVSCEGQPAKIAAQFASLLSVLFHKRISTLKMNRCPHFDLRPKQSIIQKLSGSVDKDSICQHLASFLSTTQHLRTLNLNGQPMSVASVKCLFGALQENDNWVENLSLADCELTDDSAVILGGYFHRKQVGNLDIGGNKFSYKAMAKLLEDLSLCAESGRLKVLKIGTSVVDEEESKKKQAFLDSLCALIRKARLLASLDISMIYMRSETMQSYLCFAF